MVQKMFELLWFCLIPQFTLRLKEDNCKEKTDECDWGYFVEIE